ncbi:MAG: HAMP domain-containing sensor histidine kinase [Catalinimonas sp.]
MNRLLDYISRIHAARTVTHLNQQVVVIFGLIVFLLGVGAWSAWHLIARQNEGLDWTSRRYTALDALEELSRDVVVAESETRGFLLTADTLFNLTPHLGNIKKQWVRLESTFDDPLQRAQGDTLRQMFDQRVDIIWKTALMRRSAGRQSAQIYHTLRDGRKLSFAIGRYIQQMKQYEKLMIAERRLADERSLGTFRHLSVIGCVIILLLSLYAIWLVTSEMRRRTNLERKLLSSSRQKDQLFSIISHDLRAPFNSILGLTRLMMNTSTRMSEEEMARVTQMINESAQRTSRLLQNLLEWARMQMNHSQVRIQPLPMWKVVEEELENLKMVASEKEIACENNVLPAVWVNADPHMASTVVRNLVSNALKFSYPHTTVRVGAQRRGNEWNIFVQDEGTGMTKEIQERLFKVDRHITLRGTRNEHGTGLGLLLCKEMVERQNGKLWVESVPGKGSTFFFTLRRANVSSPGSLTAPDWEEQRVPTMT